ncbi:MAG: thiamine diphosphokinase [Lachnospiraceae bacterium]|nr:thiamine diphosphokinase [Lachnospiraceae bacterium]
MDGKKAVLIGSAPLGKEQQYLHKLLSHRQEMMWIAVDGGIDYFVEHDFVPDLWIGDMDSFNATEVASQCLQRIPAECIKRVPVEKDDTDMALAVEVAQDAGCDEILLFGGIGGSRLSHTIANIQLMHDYANQGCHIQMIGENIRMEVMGPGVKAFSSDMQGHISIFALTDCVKSVQIQGMKYDYKGDLSNRHALGVSNSFIGCSSSIESSKGALLLIFEEKQKEN